MTANRALVGGCFAAGTGLIVAAIVHANRPWAAYAVVAALALLVFAGAVTLAVAVTRPGTAAAEPVTEPRHHLADQPTEILPRVRWHDLATQQLPQVRGGRHCPADCFCRNLDQRVASYHWAKEGRR